MVDSLLCLENAATCQFSHILFLVSSFLSELVCMLLWAMSGMRYSALGSTE